MNRSGGSAEPTEAVAEPAAGGARRLKICFPFIGNTLGGSHLSALLLASNLDQTAFEPLILVHREGPLSAYLNQRGIAFRYVPAFWILEYRAATLPRDALRLLPATLAMTRFLRTEKVDIVHTNDNRTGTTWAPPAHLAGCGLVWHQRTRPMLSRRMRFFAGLADHIVCISDYCSTAFRGPAFESHLSVVHNPFAQPADLPSRTQARAKLQAELGVPQQTRLVAFVANILPHKRPLVFVEAAKRLTETFRDPLAFVVLGKAQGPLYEEMRRHIAQSGLDDRFHFLGFREPVEAWIRGCDLLLSPSIEEGFGRTLVEAMLTGTPVVAAASGGYREIVRNGENGLLVPVDDAPAFAEAAAKVLSNPDLATALTRTAAADAREHLDIASHVRQMTAIYRSLGKAGLEK